MKNLLHIICSPRGTESRTLKISSHLETKYTQTYPDILVDRLDLFSEDIPQLDVIKVKGKYILMGGEELSGKEKVSWAKIEHQIERFKKADAYIISTPMWNFGIPYRLKQYIDIIFQPGFLFKYTENGPEGLITGKKLFVISSRGGDYSPQSPFHSYDQLEPYLRTAFSFIGFKDISFINIQPMDAGGEAIRNEKLEQALGIINKISV
jgi:FMN-dependent NADH-azoreductase